VQVAVVPKVLKRLSTQNGCTLTPATHVSSRAFPAATLHILSESSVLRNR